jgi:hypothetical protein
MNRVQALIRRAERDVVVIDAVERARAAMELINCGEVRAGDYVIDLSDHIQRLTGALLLLGYAGKE